ncbi:NUDIX domain-containing protein [Streptomyces ardesiacus]|uniref:MutT-like nucleotide pyrophosphohydrolase n=1 Tax=Streptomyces phage Gilgamesh TaxID=2599890 RepID=A0A5J6TR28_9CAUD|nr:MutT-like nucleotide pyrophosphohydrolase [Streptomyces phage Gilgamesh]QFG13235.1 MutT-like nucleotide pyrophosphohydrolase [Streptomyces phage Gilgamesh]
MPQQPVNDVMLILERDGAVCLAERQGTGYADGMLNLPSGKLDEGEDVYDAVIREALEETGVVLERGALRIVHVMHFRNPEGEPRVGWFFAARHWEGEPQNMEPHKCAGLSWHPVDHLPDTTVPYNALGIAHYRKGEPFSVHGWERSA